MVTHQNDWQRMAIMSWALGKYDIANFVETGCAEGETIGYFSKFTSYAVAVDVNKDVIEIAKKRYPRVDFFHGDAIPFLNFVAPRARTFFYIDCTWEPGCPASEQLPHIFNRWPTSTIVFVSGVALNNGSSGGQNLEEMKKYGSVIIPKYSMNKDQSGYGIIVPKNIGVWTPDSWEIV